MQSEDEMGDQELADSRKLSGSTLRWSWRGKGRDAIRKGRGQARNSATHNQHHLQECLVLTSPTPTIPSPLDGNHQRVTKGVRLLNNKQERKSGETYSNPITERCQIQFRSPIRQSIAHTISSVSRSKVAQEEEETNPVLGFRTHTSLHCSCFSKQSKNKL